MAEHLRALIVEDQDDDARLLLRELRKGGYDVTHSRVETPAALASALDDEWDVVFADYSMPRFTGLQALEIVRGRTADLPFMFVSGTIGETLAVEAMKAGADDYFLKGDLHRLVPAVGRELRDARARRERRRMEAERAEAQEALRLSEERHRLLFEHIADAILVFDREGVIQFASASVGEVLGVPSGELLGRSSLDIVHPEDRGDAEAAFRRSLSRPDAVETVEVRMRYADGSWRPVDSVLRNLLHGEGIEGVVVTCRDLTERKRLEAEMRQAQKLESIGRLAGGIAHDFNNLLTAILGHADFLLVDGTLDERQSTDVEQILKAGERAKRLTNQLLAFSRRQVLDLKLIDVNQVISDLAPMLRRLLGETVRVTTTLDPDLGTVRADVGQMEQVVVNLAVNARDAMPEGGHLTIGTRVVEVPSEAHESGAPPSPGTWVCLSVDDTGHGMDAGTRSRLFDPFFTTKPEGEGTGLGLSTVYGIVKQSGGDIVVRSEPGEGTRFEIYLPRQSDEPHQRVARAGEGELPIGGTETVLVVEDEQAVRELVARALTHQGYEVLRAAGGDDADRFLADPEVAIDLLLTDAVLPGRSGKAIAEGARSHRPGLPVLYMSGYAASSLGQRGVLEPGDSLLHKPFTVTELARAVRAALDQAMP